MWQHIWFFIVGVLRFIPFALSKLIKRLLLAVFGLLVGFIGPVLAVKQLSDLFSPGLHAWHAFDVFAEAANKDGKFGDIILACMPGAFLCVTDFMGHVFDDHFAFAKARLPYLGLALLELVGLSGTCFLIAGYVKLPTPTHDAAAVALTEPPAWFAQFDNAWSMAKGVILVTLVFEVLLACIESWREAQDANWQI
jgi:hypothetical protein